MESHVQPIDPNKASGDTPSTLKQCLECRAILPLSHFGKAKVSRFGVAKSCNECRGQYQRRRRSVKYGSISKIDDSIVRNMRFHNMAILKVALDPSTIGIEIRGFDVVTKVDYKVFFHPSPLTGMKSIALFDYNCQLYREFVYSGKDSNIIEVILDILRNMNIRLEYTDADVFTSKATIYYV